MNFWPFKKKPVPKPRIMKFERISVGGHADWCCGIGLYRYYGVNSAGMSCEQPMGSGKSPEAAYFDWAQKSAMQQEWRGKY
jgi:hypothetical protein